MATVEKKELKTLILEFRQEKTDDDYGSCMWARFLFDLDNYELNIISDCGNYAYGWCPTPDTESFLKLMSRINESYLLEKISSRSIVDADATWKNIKEFIDYKFPCDESDFDMEEIEDACKAYHTENEVYEALLNRFRYTKFYDNADDYDILQCIENKFPLNAEKIVSVFKNFIQPKIKELLKGGDKK